MEMSIYSIWNCRSQRSNNARLLPAHRSSCAGSPAMERGRLGKRSSVGSRNRSVAGSCGGSDRANAATARCSSARLRGRGCRVHRREWRGAGRASARTGDIEEKNIGETARYRRNSSGSCPSNDVARQISGSAAKLPRSHELAATNPPILNDLKLLNSSYRAAAIGSAVRYLGLMVAAAGLWRGRYCFTTVQCTALSIPKFSVAFWRTPVEPQVASGERSQAAAATCEGPDPAEHQASSPISPSSLTAIGQSGGARRALPSLNAATVDV